MKRKHNKYQLDKIALEDDEDLMTPEELLVSYVKKLADQKEIENYLRAFELAHAYVLTEVEKTWLRKHFLLPYRNVKSKDIKDKNENASNSQNGQQPSKK